MKKYCAIKWCKNPQSTGWVTGRKNLCRQHFLLWFDEARPLYPPELMNDGSKSLEYLYFYDEFIKESNETGHF